MYDSGTILCSRNHGEAFAHCRSRSFWVVWILSNGEKAQVQRYSSELGVWEKEIEEINMLEEIDNRTATLIGDILYWPMNSRYIFPFDNMMRHLKYIECSYETHNVFRRNIQIFKGHNGDVALAIIRGFTLETWSSQDHQQMLIHGCVS
jgi:hypothetical protein